MLKSVSNLILRSTVRSHFVANRYIASSQTRDATVAQKQDGMYFKQKRSYIIAQAVSLRHETWLIRFHFTCV